MIRNGSLAICIAMFIGNVAMGQTFDASANNGRIPLSTADNVTPHQEWFFNNTDNGLTQLNNFTLADINFDPVLGATQNISGLITDVGVIITDLTIGDGVTPGADTLGLSLRHTDSAGTVTDLALATIGSGGNNAYNGVDFTWTDRTNTIFGAPNGSFLNVTDDDPSGNLSTTFDTLDPNATWSLRLSANSPTNISFDQVTITGLSAVSGVPEPASLSLLAIGLLGMGTYRRRRKEDEEE